MEFSYGQLETLWDEAGGPADQASVAAAHAEAESGGNSLAAYPETTVAPGKGTWTDATGLWQILGPPEGKWSASELTNPYDNAEMAVAKYQEGGDTWEAWKGDDWQQYYEPGVPPAPSVPGVPGGGSGGKKSSRFSSRKFLGILRTALGDPYHWGGDSPSGFDCSGLVYWALRMMGYKDVPRTSQEQWAWVRHISRDQLQPGDLIFQNFPGEDSPGHVLVYAGHGRAIQASKPGEPVAEGPWSPQTAGGTIVGYGRIPSMTGAGGSGGSGNTGVTLTGWSPWDGFLGSGGLSQLSSIAKSLSDFEQAIDWFLNPGHWVRIGCGVAGSVLVMWGLWSISRTGHSYSVSVPVVGAVPAPEGGQLAPALGIGAITLGAICLFVALHNLPAGVSTFPALLSWLQHEAQTGGASTNATAQAD